MIYTTFEQIEYGFVLFNNFKKHSDINRFRKIKIFLIWHLRTVTVISIAYISFNSCYFLISFYIFNLINILSLSIDDEERSVDEECIC